MGQFVELRAIQLELVEKNERVEGDESKGDGRFPAGGMTSLTGNMRRQYSGPS